MPASDAILDLRSITKRFPGVLALDNVDFDLRRGEVHAMMGQNGAGKTTLVKIVTGVYRPDGGSILLGGRPYAPATPAEAERAGIRCIHQEPPLIPHLSVAENIFLGRLPKRWGRIAWNDVRARALRSIERFGLRIDVTRPLASCSTAIRQMVAIARAVDLDADIIIMDEPTSSLDPREVDQLFDVVASLRDSGVAVLYITHFIDEVYRIADRITVLRNGRRIGTFPAADLSRPDLVAHMVGRPFTETTPRETVGPTAAEASTGPALFEAEGLGRRRTIAPTDLVLRSGDVLGLAGLLGSGRTELARLIFGLDRPTWGRTRVRGKPVRMRSPRDAIGFGLGFCPEDRRAEGLIPGLSVRENLVLTVAPRLARFGIAPRRKQRAIVNAYIDALGIATTGPEQDIRELSGGNQQKVVLARWLASEPSLLILDEPTRGIDVGAKIEIENIVHDLAARGVAVLFISSELEEVVRRSHRVLVLRDRKPVGELAGDEVGMSNVLSMIAGDRSG